MIEKKYPYAYQFLSGYFHQDWPVEFDTPDDVVVNFAKSEPKKLVGQVCADIDRLLESIKPDMMPVEDLGCYYMPEADGLTLKEWLQHIKDILKSSL